MKQDIAFIASVIHKVAFVKLYVQATHYSIDETHDIIVTMTIKCYDAFIKFSPGHTRNKNAIIDWAKDELKEKYNVKFDKK